MIEAGKRSHLQQNFSLTPSPNKKRQATVLSDRFVKTEYLYLFKSV
ncbi:MAG TPA: hypothetical protein V6D35_23915 [Candidatus Sericytochromatia bacterium]